MLFVVRWPQRWRLGMRYFEYGPRIEIAIWMAWRLASVVVVVVVAAMHLAKGAQIELSQGARWQFDWPATLGLVSPCTLLPNLEHPKRPGWSL